jgi:hypothetical protein
LHRRVAGDQRHRGRARAVPRVAGAHHELVVGIDLAVVDVAAAPVLGPAVVAVVPVGVPLVDLKGDRDHVPRPARVDADVDLVGAQDLLPQGLPGDDQGVLDTPQGARLRRRGLGVEEEG